MSRGQIKNATGDSFFVWEGDVLVVNILGKPSSSKDAIGKPKGTQLKISVTAAPIAGKATDHMVRFLAPLFGVAVADIEVVFGRENVNKQLRIKAPKKLPAVFAQESLFDAPIPRHCERSAAVHVAEPHPPTNAKATHRWTAALRSQ